MCVKALVLLVRLALSHFLPIIAETAQYIRPTAVRRDGHPNESPPISLKGPRVTTRVLNMAYEIFWTLF